MDDEQRHHLAEIRHTYRQRLRVLEKQLALQGVQTPPHVLIEIEELERRITDIESQLKEQPEINTVDLNLDIECDAPIIHGFGEVWFRYADIKRFLECPPTVEDTEKATKTTIQFFEKGIMIWLSDDGDSKNDGVVYVFYNEEQTFQRTERIFPAIGVQGDGMYTVDVNFEGIYWRMTSLHLRQRLGKAIENAVKSDGVYQKFQNGRMFWIKWFNDIYAVWEYNNGQRKIRNWRRFEDVRWWESKD